MIKFSTSKPPVYEKCVALSGMTFDDGLIITYGDTIHAKERLFPDFVAHELVHVKQQKDMGVKEWWDRYFRDAEFRKSQELEAYREQMLYINRTVKNRENRFKMKHHLAKSLATGYGDKMMTMAEALKALSV